eukprot:jgi/Mesvir1/6208/Mv00890-RA.1
MSACIARAAAPVAVDVSASVAGRRADRSGAHAPRSSFKGVRQAALPGASFARTASSGKRMPVSTHAAMSLADDVEKRMVRAQQNPLEGVSFNYSDFDALLGKFDFNFGLGDKVTGVIFKIDNKGAYVDIGAKAAAFCPLHEISLLPLDRAEDIVEVGQKREFVIVRDDAEDGVLTVSIRKLEYEIAWQRVKQLQAEDVMVRGEVVSVNRGGVLVMVESLRGFVPASHLNSRLPRDDMMGQFLALKFIEVDEERTRLVLSNRKAMAEQQLKEYKVGDVVIGKVQAVKPYGAFVDIGGVNGLLHISQISHDRIANVENVLSEGDELKVMILSQDRERGRISLSTKKLEPTPGDMLRDPALAAAQSGDLLADMEMDV